MNTPINIYDIPPGEVVVREFSCGEAARACGISRSTVLRWSQPKPRGTGGIVPSVYHVPLLQLAHQLGRKLTADDLVFGRHANRGG